MTIRTQSDHRAAGPIGHHYHPGGIGTLQIGGSGDRVCFESADDLHALISEAAALYMEMTGALLPGQLTGDDCGAVTSIEGSVVRCDGRHAPGSHLGRAPDGNEVAWGDVPPVPA